MRLIAEQLKGKTITLDGKAVTDVGAADVEEGYVDVAVRNPEVGPPPGELVHYKRRAGKVAITDAAAPQPAPADEAPADIPAH